MKSVITALATTSVLAAEDFVFVESGTRGPPGYRMVSRTDLENDSDLKNSMVGQLDAWGIVKIADGGKLDGRGYGGKIHDTHGPECCATTAWIRRDRDRGRDAVDSPNFAADFQLISSKLRGERGWRLASREDLEQNSTLKGRVVREIGTWGIVKIANGGKLDGSGYGSKIHDTHGPECCSKSLWIRDSAKEPEREDDQSESPLRSDEEPEEEVRPERPTWRSRGGQVLRVRGRGGQRGRGQARGRGQGGFSGRGRDGGVRPRTGRGKKMDRRPTAEQRQRMMKMVKALEDLGPCAKVVKETMMECFFVMEAGVRDALEKSGLTPEVSKKVGGQAGSCYEKGLNNLGKCIAQQKEQEQVQELELGDGWGNFGNL